MSNQEMLTQYQQQKNKLEQEKTKKCEEINQLREQIGILTGGSSQSFPENYIRDMIAPLYAQLHKAEDAYKKIQSQIKNVNYAISLLQSASS